MALFTMLLVIGFAIFPAAVLTGFIISHYRRRLGWRLATRSLSLGVIAAMVAISLQLLVGPPHLLFSAAAPRLAAHAFLSAGLIEEGAKFLMLYFIVREHKDCDSGGDLFSAAMLVGLGFAALENVFYLLGAGEAWLSLGMMRGVLAIPGHAVFGCLMGFFAARAVRGHAPGVNWTLSLLSAILVHGLYDLPLMTWDHLGAWPAHQREELWFRMFWLLAATLGASGALALYFCRRELVEIFTGDVTDPDLHLPAGWAVKPWRWLGNLMIGASLLAIITGGLLLFHGRIEGAFLVLPSIFPQAFGWIMRLRPPAHLLPGHRPCIAQR